MYTPSTSTTARRATTGRWAASAGKRTSPNLSVGLALLIIALLLIGCESLGYFPHLIGGHFELLADRESIDALIADPDTEPTLRERLQTVDGIRRFAAEALHLPAQGHYRTYVALDRPHVTWNVYATPEFSLAPKTWKYPIIGAAGYRGYFTPERAEACASKLRDSGFDVYIAGASAYSTLGWFEDPLPSTVIVRDEIALANLIFHELAHQLLYVAGDTVFNESFATAVADEGTRRYLASSDNPRQRQQYRLRRIRHRQFTALVAEYRGHLENLYRRNLAAADMRRRKQAVFADMTAAYEELKSDWQGYAGYDAWFEPPLNNAKIAAISTYHGLVAPFLQLLQEKNGNLPAFYSSCRDLAELPIAERRQQLQRGAPTPSASLRK